MTDDEFARRVRQAVQVLPDAPAHLQRAAVALWNGSAMARPSTLQALVQTVLEPIRALLSFDSWAAPALAPGLRSVRSQTRQLTFSSPGMDIDLRVIPAAESWLLAGQLLGPEASGRVELRSDGNGSAAYDGRLDELGEFRLDGLREGSYTLTLHLDAADGEGAPAPIVIAPLQVGSPSD